MAWFLALHGPNRSMGQSNRFQLAHDADPQQIADDLDSAAPGEFVKVPIEFQDQIHNPVTLRVQPSLYGAWVIYEAEVGRR